MGASWETLDEGPVLVERHTGPTQVAPGFAFAFSRISFILLASGLLTDEPTTDALRSLPGKSVTKRVCRMLLRLTKHTK